MARKKSSKKRASANKPNTSPTAHDAIHESYTFPALHDAIHNEVRSDVGSTCFRKSNNGANNEHPTNIMSKFLCANDGCPTRRWTSKTVAIVIRGFPRGGYNAEVFNQRCRECNELGRMTIDEDSYVERVAYRLRRWAGAEAERPPYGGDQGPPHERSLCEGCKRGYCQARRTGYFALN